MSAFWQALLTGQGLLGISFAVYWLTARGMPAALRLRLARYAVLGALLVPAVLFSVPSRHLPRLPLGESGVVSEAIFRAPISRSRHARVRVEVTSTAQAAETPALWRSLLAHALWGLAVLAGFLALGGVFYRARKVSVDFRRLAGIVRTAHVLKRFGKVRVLAHAGVHVPFSFRTPFFAWIVVPESFASRAGDLRLAIRHELQHHRAGDTTWVYLFEALAIAMWFNPFVHAWKREVNELQEFACDAALLAQSRVSRRGYADCLLRVAEAALESRAVFAGTTNMAAGSGNPARFQSFLGRRIAMLMKNPRPGSKVAAWQVGVTGTLLSLVLLTGAYGSQQILRGPVEDRFAPGVANVDRDVQAIAEESLAEAVRRHKASGGFAIVEEPSTGRVLAIANIDNSAGFQPRSPHWAVGRRFEPASIAKGVVAAEAIDQGRVKPDDTIVCDQGGVYVYHGKTYRDWETKGFGSLTVTDTIARSSNLCGIKIGEKLGAQGIDQMLRNFGFGPGGVAERFPEARAGLLPAPDESADSQYVPVVATGYSLYVSPLEVLNAYSAIANGGVLLQPVVASDKGGIERKRVISSKTATEMRAILQAAVTRGTGHKNAESVFYTTAGKTATMNSPDHTGAEEHGLTGSMNAAGFVGFAPVNQPRVAVYVAIFEPTDSDGAHGASHAAPVFREIVDRVLQSWQVTPDRKL